jgi:glycosyltransferase involved in cell wall biosynthesis
MRPKLGIVALAPIQYHTPLFQLLARRGNVDLDVLFLSDRGFSATIDPQFGSPVAWDIDLLSGYPHQFLSTRTSAPSAASRALALAAWLPAHDAVVVSGYNSPWMLLTMAICRARGIPYILRASSHPQGMSAGYKRYLRWFVTRMAVTGSSACLSMGILNEDFYRLTRARSVVFAPNSVDDERFARTPTTSRENLLAKLGLEPGKPVILFSGKLIPRKRPLDLVSALTMLPHNVNTLFVGAGVLAERVRDSLDPACGVVTGFVNQSELPAYYHAADILVLPSDTETWGLVVNEAMAAGALPVVSDMVGCAPDLVAGVGEVYKCGDVLDLAKALGRALCRITDSGTRERVRQHAARYCLARTAIGYEMGALAALGKAAGQSGLATASGE